MNKKLKAKTICKRFIDTKSSQSLDAYLIIFWSQFQSQNKNMKEIKPCSGSNQTNTYKLNLLKAMTDIVLEKPEYNLRRRRREGFNESRNKADTLEDKNEQGMYVLSDTCFVCEKTPHHRHHIVQLQNGGRNIYKNIVHLCKKCHIEVHR